MAFNQTIVVILLATVVAVLAGNQTANNLIVGARAPGDYLLEREIVKKPSRWLQCVELQKTFSGNNYGKITQIKLLDQNKKGNGATPTILTGGPGKSFTTVHFKSIRGHSIDFIVELYGR